VRLLFGEDVAEIQVSHEKGVRHTSPEDLVKLVVNRVNAAFSRRILRISPTA
jgi:hypothetical protein